MGLIKRINTVYELKKEFEKFNRDYYTLKAYETILEYYGDFGEDIELDVIDIASKFDETLDVWDLIENYGLTEWYDKIDLSDIELTIDACLEIVSDEEYLFENLPEDVCYYDNEIKEYVIPDYDRKVKLEDISNNHLLKSELLNHEYLKDMIEWFCSKKELFELVIEELSMYTTAWNLEDSILYIVY